MQQAVENPRLISLAAGLVGAVSSIGLAVWGFGLWALVLGDVPRARRLPGDLGEVAEQVEGAPLLREYGTKSHRGFESLSLRHFISLRSIRTRSSVG